MKKITSLILVAMMLLAMLPMCFMTAAAALPTETFGNYTFETVTIYDKGDPTVASGSWQHTEDAAGSVLAASGKNPAEAAGILIDVKWDALASGKTYARFKFKFNNVTAGDTGGYYLSKDGQVSGQFDDDNWLQIPAAAFDGTIFLPAEYFAGALENVTVDNAKKVSVALADTDKGTWDNVRLAYGSFVPVTQETVGSSKLDTITIYAGSVETTKGVWLPFQTDLTGVTANGKTAKEAIGVLVDVKWTGATSTFKFKFQFDNQPREEGSNGGTNGYYYAKGSTELTYFGVNNWLEINKTDFEGTIFMPKEGFINWDTTATFNWITFQSQNAADATASNVRLAYGTFEAPKTSEAPDGPKVLPDVNAEYDAMTNLFKPERVVTPNDTGWSSASMVAENTNSFITGDRYGVMFTIDGTQAAAGKTLGVTFCLQVKWKNKDGKTGQTYLAPTPYGASINTQTFKIDGVTTAATLAPLQGQSSTWYVSYDGATWESFDVQRTLNEDGSTKTGGRYAELAVGGKTAVVYVPMSEFYTRDGVYWLENNAFPTNDQGVYQQEECVDFATFESIVGKEWYISLDKFFWGGDLGAQNSGVKLSNFWVVGCDHNWTKGDIVTAPTHTKLGWQEAHCEKCKIDSIVAVDKTTEHEWPTEYTKIDENKHAIVCPCGEKQEADHTWGEATIVLPPNHLVVGVSQQVCTAPGCGATKNVEVPKTEEHDYTYTKLDEYQHNKSCACGENVNEDHTWNDGVVTTEATVEAEGVKTFTCTGCEATKTEAIAKLPAPAAPAGDAAEEDGGCGSVIGSGFAMMAILSGAAVVLTKKRRK